MLPRRFRLVLGLILIAAATPLCLWGFWPPARNSREVNITPLPGLLPPQGGEYHLDLTWTGRLRAGEEALVQARLEESGLDDQVHWMVEARLELPGLQVEPNETQQSPRLTEEPVVFTWTVRGRNAGVYPGRVWIFVQPAQNGAGVEAENFSGRNPLAALPVEVEVTRLLFLNAKAARLAGVAALLAGLALLFWASRSPSRPGSAADTHDQDA